MKFFLRSFLIISTNMKALTNACLSLINFYRKITNSSTCPSSKISDSGSVYEYILTMTWTRGFIPWLERGALSGSKSVRTCLLQGQKQGEGGGVKKEKLLVLLTFSITNLIPYLRFICKLKLSTNKLISLTNLKIKFKISKKKLKMVE